MDVATMTNSHMDTNTTGPTPFNIAPMEATHISAVMKATTVPVNLATPAPIPVNTDAMVDRHLNVVDTGPHLRTQS